MDKGVINLVNYFNLHGLKTYMSCEGHWWYPSMSLFWISFDKEVSDKDIIAFKNTHRNLSGWFVKKYIDNITGYDWRYVCRNKRVAKLDYIYLMSLN